MKRPRVVWVGVREETGALQALQRDVVKSMVPLGFEPERRAFHPHLTLGRTRRNVSSASQRELGESLAGVEVGELAQVQVASFRLMRSDLRPGGAIYTPLAVLDLGAGPGSG
jgi:2'-5' RNA ligase